MRRLILAIAIAMLAGGCAQPIVVPQVYCYVAIDEAHDNYHVAEGRYEPFAELLESNAFVVHPLDVSFTTRALRHTDVLVIANARPSEGDDPSAFTARECHEVSRWVRGGGALLLIADHAPFGGAAARLAGEFDVDMRDSFTMDPVHHVAGSRGGERWLVFSRENGLLGEHVITRGGWSGMRVDRVETFAGQSIRGPENSTVLLTLADTAVDLPRRFDRATDADVEPISAAGRAQGLAMRFGKGRVVVLGEAAMLSSQNVSVRGSEPMSIGFDRESNDNRQFALNIVHWLAGHLDD